MTVQEMKASYKFVLYLISLACVWWLFEDYSSEMLCFAMMMVSCWWCIHGNSAELLARRCLWVCSFFWSGILAVIWGEGLAVWLAFSVLLGLFFQFLASVRSWYEPGCVPMDDC